MRAMRLLAVAAALGLAVCGCRKSKTPAEPNKGTTTAEQTNVTEQTEKTGKTDMSGQAAQQKETAMGIKVQWLGHASFKITGGTQVIYIDPWKIAESPHDATLVLVSHSHHDHYSPEDIEKVSGPDVKLISSVDVMAKEGSGEALLPGLRVVLPQVKVTGVPAYNPAKEFHPRSNNWVGFLIELGSARLYYAGDTDLTEDMKGLSDIDIALLPVGGKYTMSAAEAAEATRHIKPKHAIPYHWGDIVGTKADAESFAKTAACPVKVLEPGQSVEF